MSKLGKKPIAVPAGVEVKLHDNALEIRGKESTLTVRVLPWLKVAINQVEGVNQITISPQSDDAQARANWGTMAALTKNAIAGVTSGFTKTLEIEGIGFKASMEGNKIVLNVGFTHPVKMEPPVGVKVSVEKNLIKITGVDKALVGETAANIRKIKKPEPYKSKGIRYQGEVVRRKQGKKVAGTTS